MKIALIAHDHKKDELVEWALKNLMYLNQHQLFGTKTTATRLTKDTGLVVQAYLSGPQGGDQQIGAKIAEGEIDCLIFFWDPLASQPHDPDVRALLRIAVLKDIPVAMNPSTANLLIQNKKR
jgi:methylglyoxal synthase